MCRTSCGLAIAGLVGAGVLLISAPSEGQRPSRLERQQVNGRDVVAREVLVRFRDDAPSLGVGEIAAEVHAQEINRIGRAGAARVRSRSLSASELIAKLKQRGDVVYVEPN